MTKKNQKQLDLSKEDLELQNEKNRLHEEEQLVLYKRACEAHSHKPVTRRDFLSHGLISFTAAMASPGIASLILNPSTLLASDQAECADDVGGHALCPFIGISLSGGASMFSEVIPMDVKGDPLPEYDTIGLGANAMSSLSMQFGNTPFHSRSNMLAGILESIPDMAVRNAIFSKTTWVSMCAASQDDTSTNMKDITGLVLHAGLVGTKVSNAGNGSNTAAGHHSPAVIVPPPAARLTSVGDVVNATSIAGNRGLATLSEKDRGSLFNLINKLSDSDKKRIIQSSGGKTLSHLVQCATAKNIDLASTPPPPVDARRSESLKSIWNINEQTGANTRDAVFASLSNLALTGLAGPVNLVMGGYDYHGTAAAQGRNIRNKEAGQVIGKILATAHAQSQKVFLHITTDGAVSFPRGSSDYDAMPSGDGGSRGGDFLVAYDPAKKPDVKSTQIGGFNINQGVDRSTVVGADVIKASAAVFANYLAYNNKLNLASASIGNVLTSEDLKEVLKFTGS